MQKPVIIVHGGAWNIPDELVKDHIKGVEKAASVGWKILRNGGSALDAVEEAVKTMEDDPTFDAGKGSFLNEEGFVELDAIIMDGSTLDVGAVAAVRNIKNPVVLARKVMELIEHVLLVGEGANKFAEKIGLKTVDPKDLVLEREIERWKQFKEGKISTEDLFGEPKGTVGAVALDKHGNFAAATSTGGVAGKMVGRVGDTPIVGCGAYADNNYGAVSSTGHGEKIMKIVLAKEVINFIAQGCSAQEAADKGIKLIWERLKGGAGVIVIDKNGNIGISYNTPRMAYAYVKNGRVYSGI
ncbi:MAG: isoaspartyl peptidase/L-asparaginase [Candidatus Baldrarchaeia archaeon]